VDNLEVQKLNLKIQALGESFSSKAVQYENQIADLRVELTLVSNELEDAKKRLNENVQSEAEEQ
jgi:hypothetical protein